MQKEIGFLFNGDMARAILAGRKTQTRRVIKTPKGHYGFYVSRNHDRTQFEVIAHDEHERTERSNGTQRYIYPPAQPGDLLYVRETFFDATKYKDSPLFDGMPKLYYRADSDRRIGCHNWRPSIHMPREAARIWLEVESVRVERLQDIGEEDAKAEGVQENACDAEVAANCISSLCKTQGCAGIGEYYRYPVDFDDEPCYSAKESFETLWQSINGADSWQANPWVWVVTFKAISTTGKPAKEGVNP